MGLDVWFWVAVIHLSGWAEMIYSDFLSWLVTVGCICCSAVTASGMDSIEEKETP